MGKEKSEEDNTGIRGQGVWECGDVFLEDGGGVRLRI